MSTPPTRVLERQLLHDHSLIAGMDEVGRGALAGPVSVGVVVIDKNTGRMPAGLRDSKLLSPKKREQLVQPVLNWARTGGVGHASPEEIDRYGITAALAIAGHRALHEALGQEQVGVLLLDGVHDWLNSRVPTAHPCPTPRVETQVKGDERIAVIAAASILAKTQRDALMVAAHQNYGDYGWDSNKGYASPTHLNGIRERGASSLHRKSWKLPVGPAPVQNELF